MEETPINADNFDTICRACLSDLKGDIAFNMYSFLIQENVIADVLSQCAAIQIDKDDVLPKNLCQQCLIDLTNSYEFLSKCQKAEETLQNILKDMGERRTIKTEETDMSSAEKVNEEENKPIAVIHLKQRRPKRPSKPFCEYCNLIFKDFDEYEEHMRNIKHPRRKNFECTLCHKRFNAQYHLNNHLRTHTKEKPFECELCAAKFTSETNLKRHNIIHTSQKPFVCHICGKGFSQKDTLKIHMRSHTGEKPFKCNYCDKAFRQSSALRAHTFTHTGEKPYVCQTCNNGFKQLAHLKVHVQTQHTLERPYKCSFCAKRFGVKASLTIHERIHTGEMPFKCEYCMKSFYDSRARRKHIIKMHATESCELKEEVLDL